MLPNKYIATPIPSYLLPYKNLSETVVSQEFLAWLSVSMKENGHPYGWNEALFSKFKRQFPSLDFYKTTPSLYATYIYYKNAQQKESYKIEIFIQYDNYNNAYISRLLGLEERDFTDNYLIGNNILNYVPMSPDRILCLRHYWSHDMHILYETETGEFNLKLWTLLKEYKKYDFNNPESKNYAWVENDVLKVQLTSTVKNSIYFSSQQANLKNNIITFEGYSIQYTDTRFEYYSHDYRATFNIFTGELTTLESTHERCSNK